MDVYIFQAALLCKQDGEKIRRELARAGNGPEDPDDERSYDSDDFPKGPYPDGGGEADTPQHCDVCHRFLENPLTSDGMQYVLEALDAGRGDADVLAEWAAFYDLEGPVTIKGGKRYYDRGDGLVRVGEIGSVSEGTLRMQDLVPAGLLLLEELDPRSTLLADIEDRRHRGEHAVDEREWAAPSGEAEETWEEIGEALSEHAPPNAYFGGHADDPASVGFWFREDL